MDFLVEARQILFDACSRCTCNQGSCYSLCTVQCVHECSLCALCSADGVCTSDCWDLVCGRGVARRITM